MISAKGAQNFEKSILVLANDLRFATILCDLLRPYGATLTISDRARARPFFAANPDLIILDLARPSSADWLDGITLLEQFRRTRPHLLARTLVIAETTSDFLQPFLGDVPMLSKPFYVAEFLDLVGLWATRPLTFFSGLGKDWFTRADVLVSAIRTDQG